MPLSARSTHRTTWRMIVVTTFMSLLVFGVTTAALRATAQDAAPPAAAPPTVTPAPDATQASPATAPPTPPSTVPAPSPSAPASSSGEPATISKDEAPAEDPSLQEESTRRANAPVLADELPADERESADDNLTFPIDI